MSYITRVHFSGLYEKQKENTFALASEEEVGRALNTLSEIKQLGGNTCPAIPLLMIASIIFSGLVRLKTALLFLDRNELIQL